MWKIQFDTLHILASITIAKVTRFGYTTIQYLVGSIFITAKEMWWRINIETSFIDKRLPFTLRVNLLWNNRKYYRTDLLE